jgi:hypothetical protein
MRGLLLLASAVLLPVHAADSAAPAPWGKPVNGIRMALAYLPAEGLLEIAIENTTTRERLLPLGYLGGEERLKLIVGGTGGTREIAIFTGGSGPAPGRAYPFAVPLLPGSRYVVRHPTHQYWISSAKESLGKSCFDFPPYRRSWSPILRACLSIAILPASCGPDRWFRTLWK